ncbi:pilus assembly protein [Paenibacillus athensensis]|uniref:TadE-like domain-containing protein n=1 Tax=Paenibacillus athensensis TaxID=1967502 RepID=A0A4Y8QAQ9_9BACL|nr:TadE/TadG family type IV pilus assembly protein [Paenibacillus athensensis]MCD1257476.1 pilus assembly protein [Paenibacillus athensensis]
MLRFCARRDGGIVLEAALLLPLALAFLLAMIELIHVSRTELALRSATNEAVKSLAAQLHPLALLHQAQAQQNPAPSVAEAQRRIREARALALQPGVFAAGYEAYVSDELLDLWRIELAQQDSDQLLPQNLTDLTTLVYAYCNPRLIRASQFHVIGYQLPDLSENKAPYLMIEAEVQFDLRIPFFSRTWMLKKRAMERAWTGV